MSVAARNGMEGSVTDKLAKVRLSKCAMGAGEQAAVARVLEKEYLGMGEETRAFEVEVGAYIGAGMSVTSVATGTAALQLAVQGCGIGHGDEVIVPSLTFVSCFQAITATGAVAVPCEVRFATATIDLEDAAKRVTPRTRAIMPIHYASYLPNVEAIYKFAREHQLRVIEDAAHSFGGSRDGAKIGSVGDVLCFSFDGIKNITTGEGGAVVTADPDVRRIVEDARLLGVERDTNARYRGQRSWEFDVSSPGWRYHLSNIFAAIGRVQLRRLDSEFAPRRIALAQQYRETLKSVDGITLFESNIGDVVPHIQPVRILAGKRDRVKKLLNESGIETGLHYKPNHLLTAFAVSESSFPVTEQLYEELLTLPLHVDLTEDDVIRVTTRLIEAVSE